MTNRRFPVHMVERVAHAPVRSGAAAPVHLCAVPGCGPSDGILCERHWFELPWGVRSSVGPSHAPPRHVDAATTKALLKALDAAKRELARKAAPQSTLRATAPLTPEEERFRPTALRILAEHEPRPRNEEECMNRGRQMPCPYVSCPSHLYLTVTASGSLHFNFPGKEIHELEETCVEEVIRKNPDGLPPSKAGALVGLKKGRVNQIERMYRAECGQRGLNPWR